MRRVLVTGSSGFIGTRLVKQFLVPNELVERVVAVDKVEPYAPSADAKLRVVIEDIRNTLQLVRLLERENIDTVFHLAAIASVDDSIQNPEGCGLQNTQSVLSVMEAVRRVSEFKPVRLVNVSTDEVYGAVTETTPPLTEDAPHKPTNPYSASKAYGVALARAYHNTYGTDVVTTLATNTYGAGQGFDKLIPRAIKMFDEGKPLPVYGSGNNFRYWLHVDDHCRALVHVAQEGVSGESYNIGGAVRLTIKQMVSGIANLMGIEPENAMAFGVEDRLGHDLGYIIDSTKLTNLGWRPYVNIFDGLRSTVSWYSNNKNLWSALR